MARLEKIASTILQGNALEVRSLLQDWAREGLSLDSAEEPASPDPKLRAVAAGLVELLAARTGNPAPAWSQAVGAAPDALFLIRNCKSPKLRARVERESPEPFRKRNIFAPRNYLDLN